MPRALRHEPTAFFVRSTAFRRWWRLHRRKAVLRTKNAVGSCRNARGIAARDLRYTTTAARSAPGTGRPGVVRRRWPDVVALAGRRARGARRGRGGAPVEAAAGVRPGG